MGTKEFLVSKRINKTISAGIAAFLLGGIIWASNSWDSERLELEMSMQKRVEEALTKILPMGQFVVVIRVEPWSQPIDSKGQPIEEEPQGYYLPGVPARNKFDSTADQVKKLVDTVKPDSPIFRRFIRRITTTLVVDKDLDEATINNVRELTRQLVGLDPQRGDTLDIQRSSFQKPTIVIDNSGISKLQVELQKYWLVVGLSLLVLFFLLFALFVFGPLRGFLSRFVQILPTLKPIDTGRSSRILSEELPQMLPALLGQHMGMLQGGGVTMSAPTFSGSLQVENPNKTSLPFGFVREDHLSNLAVLLARETPERAAVVLGYLPSEWISRVLNQIDSNLQSDIAAHLAIPKQLLPEQVEDIEQDLKRRLDYLIGGPDRLISIYETLDPDAQKKMLENLQVVKPELAEAIRRRALIFEELFRLDTADLKAILREVDLQTMILCLQGQPKEFTDRILENISQGKAEIIREELDVNKGGPTRGSKDAQRKVILIARRLIKEGQIRIPEVQGNSSSARYVPLRDAIKLPPGLEIENSADKQGTGSGKKSVEEDIEERIRRFMGRGGSERERYSDGGVPPGNEEKE